MKLAARNAIVLAVALVGAIVLLAWVVPHEPWYRFHRLSYWVDRVQRPGADQAQARAAIRQIGPKAIPCLLKKIRIVETEPRTLAAWSKMPTRIQEYVPPPEAIGGEGLDKILCALSLIGAPAIPRLTPALQNTNSEFQVVAIIDAIGMMEAGQADAGLPSLVSLLHHTNSDFRAHAALAIGHMGTIKTQAIPALIVASPTTSDAVRVLGYLGPDAQLAVPVLAPLLDHPSPYLRREAALAMWRISHDPSMVDRLIAELEIARETQYYTPVLKALGSIGPAAKPAVPAILRTMTNFFTNLPRPVREALMKIDPEVVPILDHPGR